MELPVPTRRKQLIGLTPLIDVVFILLIFFMLASSFNQWQQLELQLAPSGDSAAAASDNPVWRMKIDSLLDASVDGEIKLQALVLSEAAGLAKEGLVVLLTPSAGTPLQVTMDWVNLLRTAGVKDVELVADSAGKKR